LPARLAASEPPPRAEAGLAEVKGDAQSRPQRLDRKSIASTAQLDNAPNAEEKAAAKARLEVLKEPSQ